MFLQPIFISKYRHQPSHRRLAAGFCGPEDIHALLSLQTIIEQHLPDPAIFVSTEQEEWRVRLKNPCILGLWDNQFLAAYGMFLLCGKAKENYAWHIGIPDSQVSLWANMDTIAVHPDYRGNGLETALLGRMEALCPKEIQGFCCTVSPDNPYSLQSVKRAGYIPVKRTRMYGDHDRYIFKKEKA